MLVNSYVGNYNNKYSQARINETLKSISDEISSFEPKQTVQPYGHFYFSGSIVDLANAKLDDVPAMNQKLIGLTEQGVPVDLGSINTDGSIKLDTNISSKVPEVKVSTVSFWQMGSASQWFNGSGSATAYITPYMWLFAPNSKWNVSVFDNKNYDYHYRAINGELVAGDGNIFKNLYHVEILDRNELIGVNYGSPSNAEYGARSIGNSLAGYTPPAGCENYTFSDGTTIYVNGYNDDNFTTNVIKYNNGLYYICPYFAINGITYGNDGSYTVSVIKKREDVQNIWYGISDSEYYMEACNNDYWGFAGKWNNASSQTVRVYNIAGDMTYSYNAFDFATNFMQDDNIVPIINGNINLLNVNEAPLVAYSRPKIFSLRKQSNAITVERNYDRTALNIPVGYSPYQAYWTKEMRVCDPPVLLSYENYNRDGVRLLGGMVANKTWMDEAGLCCYGKDVHFMNYIVYKTEVSYNSEVSNSMNKNVIIDLYYKK